MDLKGYERIKTAVGDDFDVDSKPEAEGHRSTRPNVLIALRGDRKLPSDVLVPSMEICRRLGDAGLLAEGGELDQEAGGPQLRLKTAMHNTAVFVDLVETGGDHQLY